MYEDFLVDTMTVNAPSVANQDAAGGLKRGVFGPRIKGVPCRFIANTGSQPVLFGGRLLDMDYLLQTTEPSVANGEQIKNEADDRLYEIKGIEKVYAVGVVPEHYRIALKRIQFK